MKRNINSFLCTFMVFAFFFFFKAIYFSSRPVFLEKERKQSCFAWTSLTGVIGTGTAPSVAYRWLERMNRGWCQMHPLKMTWPTIFLTWLTRLASPTGRDWGRLLLLWAAIHSGHRGGVEGCVVHTGRSVFPPSYFCYSDNMSHS